MAVDLLGSALRQMSGHLTASTVAAEVEDALAEDHLVLDAGDRETRDHEVLRAVTVCGPLKNWRKHEKASFGLRVSRVDICAGPWSSCKTLW